MGHGWMDQGIIQAANKHLMLEADIECQMFIS